MFEPKTVEPYLLDFSQGHLSSVMPACIGHRFYITFLF